MLSPAQSLPELPLFSVHTVASEFKYSLQGDLLMTQPVALDSAVVQQLLRLIRACLHHVCLALYVTRRPALPLDQMANTLAHLRNFKLSM
jgi:hypothetical protein